MVLLARMISKHKRSRVQSKVQYKNPLLDSLEKFFLVATSTFTSKAYWTYWTFSASITTRDGRGMLWRKAENGPRL